MSVPETTGTTFVVPSANAKRMTPCGVPGRAARPAAWSRASAPGPVPTAPGPVPTGTETAARRGAPPSPSADSSTKSFPPAVRPLTTSNGMPKASSRPSGMASGATHPGVAFQPRTDSLSRQLRLRTDVRSSARASGRDASGTAAARPSATASAAKAASTPIRQFPVITARPQWHWRAERTDASFRRDSTQSRFRPLRSAQRRRQRDDRPFGSRLPAPPESQPCPRTSAH